MIRSAYELQMRKTAETMAKRDEEIHNLETASASQKVRSVHLVGTGHVNAHAC